MSCIELWIPIALLAALALVFDPHPAPSSAADVRAIRLARWQPNRLSVEWLRRTSTQVALVAALNVRELLSF